MTSQTDGLLGKIRVVSASAGSGKTYRLTDEIRAAIVDKGIAPESIVATTFTKKAAAELEERVRTRLLADGHVDAAARLSAARLGTVNSVCGQLAADFCFDLGISPTTDVLDENRARELFKRCLAEVTKESERDQLGDIARRFNEFDWVGDVMRISEQARVNAIAAQDLEGCAAASWAALSELLQPADETYDHDATLTDALLTFLKDAEQAEADGVTGTKGNNEAKQTARGLLAGLRGGGIEWKDWCKAAQFKSTKNFLHLAEKVQVVGERMASHPQLHADLRDATFLCFGIAARSLDAYDKAKRARRAIDFVDQETLALRLLGEDAVVERLRDEISLVFVDEFQDTSPLQLAVFLRLADIAAESVWVGDQKQAIYGFRGTDPGIMDAMIQAIAAANPGAIDTLGKSYRSRPNLVATTSELFVPPFSSQGIPAHQVKLAAAMADDGEALSPGQTTDPLGPAYERWVLNGRNEQQRANALSVAVREFIDDKSVMLRGRAAKTLRSVRPGDVAILCRRRRGAALVAEALANRGVSARIPRAGLMATHEGLAVGAALRLWVDDRDTLAAAQLLRLFVYPDEPHEFLRALLPASASAEVAPGGSKPPHPALTTPLIDRLRAMRAAHPGASGLEAFDRIVDALDLREAVRSWGNSEQRLSNIDALRGHMVRFAATAMLDGSATSPASHLAHLLALAADEEDSQAVVADENAVTVATWHASKGLEWPVTVLYELEKDNLSPAWGVASELKPNVELNYAAPLDGRWVRYWPHPFHRQNSKSAVHDALAEHPVNRAAEQRQAREELRLLYVGWTRARDRLVLAGAEKRLGEGILRRLSDSEGNALYEDVTAPNLERNDGVAVATWMGNEVPVRVRFGDHEEEVEVKLQAGAALPVHERRKHPARFRRPSDIQGHSANVSATMLGTSLATRRRRSEDEAQRFGSALHAFLAADLVQVGTKEERTRRAEEHFAAWGLAEDGEKEADFVEDALSAADRLNGWMAEHWPEAELLPEWPIWFPQESGAVVRGAVDLVLKTSSGCVVIDHKTYSGTRDQAEGKAATFAGQLSAYADAIEAAGAGPVLGTFIHMPLHGMMLDVERSANAASAALPEPSVAVADVEFIDVAADGADAAEGRRVASSAVAKSVSAVRAWRRSRSRPRPPIGARPADGTFLRFDELGAAPAASSPMSAFTQSEDLNRLRSRVPALRHRKQRSVAADEKTDVGLVIETEEAAAHWLIWRRSETAQRSPAPTDLTRGSADA